MKKIDNNSTQNLRIEKGHIIFIKNIITIK